MTDQFTDKDLDACILAIRSLHKEHGLRSCEVSRESLPDHVKEAKMANNLGYFRPSKIIVLTLEFGQEAGGEATAPGPSVPYRSVPAWEPYR